MARLERDVFEGDHAPFDAAADRVADGLAELYDAETGLYAWAKMPDGALESARLDRWYADAVAQVWPLVFGVTEDADGFRQLDGASQD